MIETLELEFGVTQTCTAMTETPRIFIIVIFKRIAVSRRIGLAQSYSATPYISRQLAATRLVFLGQFYIVIIDHIC